MILRLFSQQGLQQLFDRLSAMEIELSDNAWRIFQLRDLYLARIDPVIAFLQHRDPTLAHRICQGAYLPQAGRFEQMADLEYAFGTMGMTERARHLCTLFLEDLSDLIKEAIDPHFGFSRYAERLGLSRTDFTELHQVLQDPDSIVSQILVALLEQKIQAHAPGIVCISVPFPGNLFGALKCGQYLKQKHPKIKVILGGGYANTELRSLGDERLFEYLDFVCLDDGEAPLQLLLEHLDGQRKLTDLKRVFCLHGGVVHYCNGAAELDVAQRDTGTPDYRDLLLDQYLSVIELVNPMHRLWSDGRWNKLTLAHGCYWGKCSFCDVTLDYIKRYEPLTAALLCDRIEEIIEQTGQRGFHFVDEAAPPALMRDLAIELIRRKLNISWWTNIRFEKSFTADLCRLLRDSGCIAVSGGLEVASDRLLAKMKKGVTVAQVARVCQHFSQNNIMVHAYLMYGFPTQTAAETINSLEMVRQLFLTGVLQSGFWHLFAMTAHSPVGIDPAAYGVMKVGPEVGTFANNDLQHQDPSGADHEQFSYGLRKSLFNFMNGQFLDSNLQDWFDFEVPRTTVAPNYIQDILEDEADELHSYSDHARLLWVATQPAVEASHFEDGFELQDLGFLTVDDYHCLSLEPETVDWLLQFLHRISLDQKEKFTFADLRASFPEEQLGEWEEFVYSDLWLFLREEGLLVV